MQLHNDLGQQNIKEAIQAYPEIGTILEKYGIACIKCSVGTCLLKEVVAVHVLGDEMEAQIEKEINAYLARNL